MNTHTEGGGTIVSEREEEGRGGAVVSSSFRGRGTKQQMKYNCQHAHPSSESLVVSSSECGQISFVSSLPHLPNVSIVQNWWDDLWSVTVRCLVHLCGHQLFLSV